MGETRQEVEFSRTCAFCDGGPTQPPCVECSGAGFLAVAALVPEGSLTAARLRLADAAEAWMKTGVVTSFAKFSQTMDAEWVARQEMLKARAALRTARGEG